MTFQSTLYWLLLYASHSFQKIIFLFFFFSFFHLLLPRLISNFHTVTISLSFISFEFELLFHSFGFQEVRQSSNKKRIQFKKLSIPLHYIETKRFQNIHTIKLYNIRSFDSIDFTTKLNEWIHNMNISIKRIVRLSKWENVITNIALNRNENENKKKTTKKANSIAIQFAKQKQKWIVWIEGGGADVDDDAILLQKCYLCF